MSMEFVRVAFGKKAVVGIASACILLGGSVAIASATVGSLPLSPSSSQATRVESEDATEAAKAEKSMEAQGDSQKWQNGMPAKAASAGIHPGGGPDFGQWVREFQQSIARNNKKPAAKATKASSSAPASTAPATTTVG